jgi:hypothetical protein
MRSLKVETLGKSTLAALVLSLLVGCPGLKEDPDDDSIKKVPADIRAEDATFRYVVRNGSLSVLQVRMSRANFCDRTNVPKGAQYVEISVAVSLGAAVSAGTYDVGSGRSAGLSLSETASEQYTSAGGLGASWGTVTLTSVTPDEVRGEFDGGNNDTKLTLRSAFVAKACFDDRAACL